MFAIIHNNFVVWGPKTWNKLGFEDVLRTDCEVEYTLPQRNDNLDPIIINESTKILKVVNQDTPDHNPKIHRLNGPYWNFYEDRAECYYLPEDLPIDFVKDTLKNIVAANRYAKEINGFTTTIQGYTVTIDTSREGRQIYFDTYLALGDTETVNWKFSETWLTINKSELGQIVAAGKSHIQSCFNWEKNKTLEIDSATTLADLDTIIVEYSE